VTAQVAADLRAAADVLERDGWTQGVYVANDGCRCALGAILGVVDPEADTPSWFADAEQQQRFTFAADALIKAMDFNLGLYLVDWNDDPGRTADEVIAALRAAADQAEAQQ
jgi:hypothetical protein